MSQPSPSKPSFSPELRPRKSSGLTRRGLLKAGAVGAVAVGAGPDIFSKRARGAAAVNFDEFRFLMDHCTQGFNLIEFEEVKAMGYDAWIEWQLDHENIDDTALEDWLADTFPSIYMGNGALYGNYVRTGQGFIADQELRTATLLRSVYSRRQLYERMCEFWANHFSIDQGSVSTILTPSINEVIRKHAFGKFPDMLAASSKDGAMLQYLTNDTNIVGHAQENYARELMELHTLGVTGPYDETDVEEVAKVFTGWTLYGSQLFYGNFQFSPSLHDYSDKTVLGRQIQGHGLSEGEKVVRILARRRATAKYISFKMCRWFLRYEPSKTLVNKVADTYQATGGDIKEMLRVILDLGNVMAEDPAANPKLRQPYHFVTSLCRACFVDMEGDETYNLNPGDILGFWLNRFGQPVFGNASPDGYPDDEETWGKSVLTRWWFAQALLDGQIHRTTANLGKMWQLIGGLDWKIVGEQINVMLTGGRLDPADVAEVQAYADEAPLKNSQTLRECLALAASSPSYQYY